MFLAPFGRLADIISGRRNLPLYGVIAFSASALLLGHPPSASTIIALRALQGVSSAMIFGTGVAILVSVTPPNEKGATLGMKRRRGSRRIKCSLIHWRAPHTLGWRSILLTTAGVGAIAVLWGRGPGASGRRRGAEKVGSLAHSLMLLAHVRLLARPRHNQPDPYSFGTHRIRDPLVPQLRAMFS